MANNYKIETVLAGLHQSHKEAFGKDFDKDVLHKWIDARLLELSQRMIECRLNDFTVEELFAIKEKIDAKPVGKGQEKRKSTKAKSKAKRSVGVAKRGGAKGENKEG